MLIMEEEMRRNSWLRDDAVVVIRNRKTQRTYIYWIETSYILCVFLVFLYVCMFLSFYYAQVQKQGTVENQILETEQEMLRVEILDEQLFLQMRYLKSLLKDKNTHATAS